MTEAERLAALRRLLADNLIRALDPTARGEDAPSAAPAAYLSVAMRFLKEASDAEAPAQPDGRAGAPLAALPILPPLTEEDGSADTDGLTHDDGAPT